MLLRIEEYTVDHGGVPTDEEIQQALRIKEIYDDTVLVVLKWYMNYSGWYQVDILESDKTADDVRKRMPKVYGL